MESYSYLHFGNPEDLDRNVVCKYRVTTDLPIEGGAEVIAAEQSTRTCTGISTLDHTIFDHLGARIISIEGDLITAKFSVDDFSIKVGSVSQILSVVTGNLFGLGALKGVRLKDVTFPNSILEQFKGPKFGVIGLKEALNRPEKPLVGTIMKPKIELSPEKTAEYVYETGVEGLTNSKDDKTLVDQRFCSIEDRTVRVTETLDRLESQGHLIMHAINVSTCSDRIVKLAEKVQSWGIREIMVDVITCGFWVIQALAENPSIKVSIYVHRTMHGAFTEDPCHGIATLLLIKLVRMVELDALYIGIISIGKMISGMTEDDNLRACLGIDVPYKAVMPVCSGAIYSGLVADIVRLAGTNVQIQTGRGIVGYLWGVHAGGMGMSQAIDATFLGISVEEYAKDHRELATALEEWRSR